MIHREKKARPNRANEHECHWSSFFSSLRQRRPLSFFPSLSYVIFLLPFFIRYPSSIHLVDKPTNTGHVPIEIDVVHASRKTNPTLIETWKVDGSKSSAYPSA